MIQLAGEHGMLKDRNQTQGLTHMAMSETGGQLKQAIGTWAFQEYFQGVKIRKRFFE